MPNPALDLAPFGRWTLRDKAAQRRSAPRYGSLNHRSPGMFKKLICAALLAISMGGCTQVPVTSSSHSQLPKFNSPENLDAVKTIVQVCLPNKWVAYSNEEIWLSSVPIVDSIVVQRARNGAKDHRTDYPAIDCIGGESVDRDVARRWIPFRNPDGLYPNGLPHFSIQYGHVDLEDGMFSAGSGAISLIGNTSTNQPVYEAPGRPIGTLVAVEVGPAPSVKSSAKKIAHWYILPPQIPRGSYTEWIPPVAAEDRDAPKRVPVFLQLTHGKTLQSTEVAADAPRIRVTSATVREIYDRNRCWARTQRAIAEQHYRSVVGTPLRELIHYVPKFNHDLPPC